ncbi:MAG: glycosyltransferase family protein [Bacteroidia bacterium]
MEEGKLRVLFAVQGEGRGHMTQSLALATILRNAGHEVVCAMLGTSSRREIPGFYYRKIDCPVQLYESPNFITDKNGKGIRVLPSVVRSLRRSRAYFRNLAILRKTIDHYEPDLIVNFYEPLMGILYLLHKPPVPMVTVAHQYLLHHPDFPFPDSKKLDQWMLKAFNHLTASRSVLRLALSFSPLKQPKDKSLIILPPLLRQEVLEYPDVRKGDSYLVYLLNSGYSEEIMDWHRQHPDVVIDCFWDKSGAGEEFRPHPNLTFHRIDDEKFLRLMASCRAFISTAGFESVCEAMYFQKPVMMVPVAGHIEQLCNAMDARRVGAGIHSSVFDLNKFLHYLPGHKTNYTSYRNWVQVAPQKFMDVLSAFEPRKPQKARQPEEAGALVS